jgi:hypothetical protein
MSATTTNTILVCPFVPALDALRRSEAALRGHDAVVARIDTALATHALIAPSMTPAFLQRVYTAEKEGRDPTVAMPNATDVALSRDAVRFDEELVRVREELDRHPLHVATAAAAAAAAAASEIRRAFVALFADDAKRAADLRTALDVSAERRRSAVARAVASRSRPRSLAPSCAPGRQ